MCGRDCTVVCFERIAVTRVFMRKQFYQLVWSKPLARFINFAESTRSPIRHWAGGRKGAGKRVKQIPVPEAKAGTADRITIANADLGRESLALASVREQACIFASEGGDDQAAPTHPTIHRTALCGRQRRIRAARASASLKLGVVQ